jgi:hypothetical protein
MLRHSHVSNGRVRFAELSKEHDMRKGNIVIAVFTTLSIYWLAPNLKAAEDVETFQEFLRFCEYADRAFRVDQSLSKAQVEQGYRCIYAVEGMRAIMTANCMMRTSGHGHSAPDTISMQFATTGQAIRAIVTYAQEHIDLWQNPWWMVTPWAISNKLPCKD